LFIAECTDDKLRRAVCCRILDLTDGYGARIVADGVETRMELVAVSERRLDLWLLDRVQGVLFANG